MTQNQKFPAAATQLTLIATLAMTSMLFAADKDKTKHNPPQSRDKSDKQLLLLDMPQGVVLGAPEDQSITLNIFAKNNVECFVEYGLDNSKYDQKSASFNLAENQAKNITLADLQPNSKYFYRIAQKKSADTIFSYSPQFTFHTARPPGDEFCFVVQADSHLDRQSSTDLYKNTLRNELAEKPDFMIDLGDTAMIDKLNNANITDVQNRYLTQRGFFSLITHSVPLFLVLGNHDGETGWDFAKSPQRTALALAARKSLFQNPQPDAFYSGNSSPETFDSPQNYYAWSWGDALFVVLDPYSYTVTKPGNKTDNWAWTLGNAQYRWLKNTLENSHDKFKFVFCHQIIGGGDTDGRGGAEFVKFYEMGGSDKDNKWAFPEKRPDWPKTIHQLFIDYHVTIFFHGHDHFFAKQQLDGVIYQLVPQPSHPAQKNNLADNYGYRSGDFLPNSGHLRVTVSPDSVKVDYILSIISENESPQRKNRQTACSYTIKENKP